MALDKNISSNQLKWVSVGLKGAQMCIKDFMKFIQDTINVSWMVMLQGMLQESQRILKLMIFASWHHKNLQPDVIETFHAKWQVKG